MSHELKSALIAHACHRLMRAETRLEQERILMELWELVRAPLNRVTEEI